MPFGPVFNVEGGLEQRFFPVLGRISRFRSLESDIRMFPNRNPVVLTLLRSFGKLYKVQCEAENYGGWVNWGGSVMMRLSSMLTHCPHTSD